MKDWLIKCTDMEGKEHVIILRGISKNDALTEIKGRGLYTWNISEYSPKPPPTDKEMQNKTVLMQFGGCMVLVFVFVGGFFSCVTPHKDPPRASDPRDERWNTPAGRQVIKAMAEESGISEAEMRKRTNDSIDYHQREYEKDPEGWLDRQ